MIHYYKLSRSQLTFYFFKQTSKKKKPTEKRGFQNKNIVRLKWGRKTGSKSRTKTEGDEKLKEKQQQNIYHAEREEILTRQDRIMPKLVISQYDVNPPGM